ncbi:stage VI sporulation protein D [Salirhabdus salicampi]|uniref:stage VI sporulation protein D n=1 Tax=Salirhabdus salicampi TaxID=476102 RepID=UPI0020C299DF|nr:stage VI sporulation protein D [Salirhabdus salicampi]MCP8617022.1 stage VI sporulation protein D [Salirhabdus salicampi]
MSQEEQNVFTFELNELLWFKKGQEVQELIGIALEPDISIHEAEDQIFIRGVIELSGEYMPAVSDRFTEDENQIISFQDHSTKRYILDVRSFEDGLNEFHYNIPVEITIPKYRIPSLDDVMVEVDHFDYEIPDTSRLKLQARVIIHGIKQETIETEQVVERGEEESSTFQWESKDQQFSFDVTFKDDEAFTKDGDGVKDETEEASTYEPPRDEQPVEVDQVIVEDDEETTIEMEAEAEEEKSEEKEKDRWFHKKKSQTFEEFFAKGKDEPKDEDVEESSQWGSVSPSSDDDETKGKLESSDEYARDETSYLIDMFGNGEDAFTKIRMCIVQQSDTLDTIAERYELPKTQIIRVNNIEENDIREGEILYIPVSKKEKKS